MFMSGLASSTIYEVICPRDGIQNRIFDIMIHTTSRYLIQKPVEFDTIYLDRALYELPNQHRT